MEITRRNVLARLVQLSHSYSDKCYFTIGRIIHDDDTMSIEASCRRSRAQKYLDAFVASGEVERLEIEAEIQGMGTHLPSYRAKI